jgi:hypothetical protein
MKTTLVRFRTILWFLALATTLGVPALAEIKATATRSLTVQPAGPRQGEPGIHHFNVEETKNDMCASSGVLVSELPEDGDQAVDVERLSLRLLPSLARLSNDGNVPILLAEPEDRGMERLAGSMFEGGPRASVRRGGFRLVGPRLTVGDCHERHPRDSMSVSPVRDDAACLAYRKLARWLSGLKPPGSWQELRDVSRIAANH